MATGGRLIIADFAPHGLEFLREQHQHRRLGYPEPEIGPLAGRGPASARCGHRRPTAGPQGGAHRQDLDRRARPRTAKECRMRRRLTDLGDRALGPIARAGGGAAPRPGVSFEFSPPKTPEAEETLWEAIRRLEPLDPTFVSVTYGAGGSTRERTHRTVLRMLKRATLRPAAPDLRRGQPWRGRRGDPRLLGWRHPPHRGAARRRPPGANRRQPIRRAPTAMPTPPN